MANEVKTELTVEGLEGVERLKAIYGEELTAAFTTLSEAEQELVTQQAELVQQMLVQMGTATEAAAATQTFAQSMHELTGSLEGTELLTAIFGPELAANIAGADAATQAMLRTTAQMIKEVAAVTAAEDNLADKRKKDAAYNEQMKRDYARLTQEQIKWENELQAANEKVVAELEKVAAAEKKAAEEAGKKLEESINAANKQETLADQVIDKLTKWATAVGAVVAAYASFQTVKHFVEESIGEALKADNEWKTLAATLETTERNIESVTASIADLAKETENLTKFSGGQVVAATSQLAIFKSLSDETMPRVIELAEDMARLFGRDLSSQAVLLGKALESPTQASRLLKQAGITLTDAVEDEIKALDALGDTAGAQAILLAELESKFTGLAETLGETLTDRIDRLGNKVSTMYEEVGTALLPILEKFIELGEAAVETGLAITGVLTPADIGELDDMFEDLKGAVYDVGDAVIENKEQWQEWIDMIALVVESVHDLESEFGFFSNIAKDSIDAVVPSAIKLSDALSALLSVRDSFIEFQDNRGLTGGEIAARDAIKPKRDETMREREARREKEREVTKAETEAKKQAAREERDANRIVAEEKKLQRENEKAAIKGMEKEDKAATERAKERAEEIAGELLARIKERGKALTDEMKRVEKEIDDANKKELKEAEKLAKEKEKAEEKAAKEAAKPFQASFEGLTDLYRRISQVAASDSPEAKIEKAVIKADEHNVFRLDEIGKQLKPVAELPKKIDDIIAASRLA